MAQYLQALSPEQLDAANVNQYLRNQKIIALTPEDYPDFVEEFDYWLATLPQRSKKNITVSVVSARLGVSYSLAESILRYAEKQKILDKHYIIKCPDCNNILEKVSQDELAEALLDPVYCDECDQDKHITLDNVYTAYRVIQEPNVSEEEIAKAIEKRLNQGDSTTVNFTVADSLSHDINTLYEVFYNPDESAYQKFQELQEKLDLDYGKNTTAQGNALEKLIKEVGFNPTYYTAIHQNFDLPYDIYRPELEKPRTQIEMIRKDGSLAELSQLSPLVAALAGTRYGDNRFYFPKEMLEVNGLFSKQVEEFTSYITNDYFTGETDVH